MMVMRLVLRKVGTKVLLLVLHVVGLVLLLVATKVLLGSLRVLRVGCRVVAGRGGGGGVRSMPGIKVLVGRLVPGHSCVGNSYVAMFKPSERSPTVFEKETSAIRLL